MNLLNSLIAMSLLSAGESSTRPMPWGSDGPPVHPPRPERSSRKAKLAEQAERRRARAAKAEGRDQ